MGVRYAPGNSVLAAILCGKTFGGFTMHTYREHDREYHVFFVGDDSEHRIRAFSTEPEAAALVNYLNGGTGALPATIASRGGMLR